jgi:hypothetical protein
MGDHAGDGAVSTGCTSANRFGTGCPQTNGHHPLGAEERGSL